MGNSFYIQYKFSHPFQHNFTGMLAQNFHRVIAHHYIQNSTENIIFIPHEKFIIQRKTNSTSTSDYNITYIYYTSTKPLNIPKNKFFHKTPSPITHHCPTRTHTHTQQTIIYNTIMRLVYTGGCQFLSFIVVQGSALFS